MQDEKNIDDFLKGRYFSIKDSQLCCFLLHSLNRYDDALKIVMRIRIMKELSYESLDEIRHYYELKKYLGITDKYDFKKYYIK